MGKVLDLLVEDCLTGEVFPFQDLDGETQEISLGEGGVKLFNVNKFSREVLIEASPKEANYWSVLGYSDETCGEILIQYYRKK